ncbi:phytanoyl-CoA dioxygenase family protein [Amycolatopsis sp. NPDC051102]|uniref:phytanoyl-CoA dioxygenase family protein n=1 Tax=Amycolatopsis sp. NPDC051102 TaxID=3155163 RepID=UPI00343D8E34
MGTGNTGLELAQLDRLEAEGYLVIPDVLTAQECEELASEMELAWKTHGLERQSSDMPGVRFINNALAYSAALQKPVLAPAILSAVRAVIGDRVLLNLVNSRTPGPQAKGQPLHDLSRRRGRPFFKCSAIWCLDEFTEENGATRVLPGSHLDDTEALRHMGDPFAVHPHEVIVEAPKGAVIFHNSHLIHSGRANRSARDRRSIHAAYTPPSEETHYDWTALPDDIVAALTDDMLDVLGLRNAYLEIR